MKQMSKISKKRRFELENGSGKVILNDIARKKDVTVMQNEIKPEIYRKDLFFSHDFPFSVLYVENRSDYYNLSKRFQRQFWKITLIVSGEGNFVVGSRKFPFRKNTLIIVHPKEPTTWDISGEKIVLYNVLFDKSLIPSDLAEMEDPIHLSRIFSPEVDVERTSPWLIMNADRKIITLVRTLHSEFRNSDLNRKKMLILYFHQLLLLLIRQSERKYRRHPEWTANYVREHIRKNYASDISLSRLAGELHLTPERLCRLYAEHFGITLKKQINMLRVESACGMLENTELGLPEIRIRSGFHDLSNFYRIFRSLKGMTPRQYRANVRK